MDVRWELKNKKTGKLYWLDDNDMENLKRLGLQGKYLITEIKPLITIKNPLNIEIKKSTKTNKREN